MDPIFTPAAGATLAAGIAPSAAGMLAGTAATEAVAAGLAVPAATASGIGLGTALSAGGLLFSGLSAISGGNQAAANARYQADLYQRQADREKQLAALDEAEYRRRGSALLATQRARLGDAGVDFTGTALDLSAEAAAQLELQALKIRSGGLAKADDDEGQAALTRYGGLGAQRRSYLSAAGSTLGGLGDLLKVKKL